MNKIAVLIFYIFKVVAVLYPNMLQGVIRGLRKWWIWLFEHCLSGLMFLSLPCWIL
jgi:hypothetical protein